MFTIEIFDSLSADLDEKVKRYRKQAHLTDKPPLTAKEEAKHNDKYCSLHDRLKQLLAYEKDEIIGGTILYKRVIPYNGQDILLGGIGGVWTRKDKRRQGAARMHLKKGMQILNNEKCDIVYLCTDITRLSPLYEAHGFKHLKNGHTYLGASGKRYLDKDGMIAPLRSKLLFNQILTDKKPFDIGSGNW